jgi:phage shock protein C
MIDRIVSYFERYAFGVCSWLGYQLGLKSSKIRMFFIYLSFFTVGSPIIIYLGMAFILEHKDFFKFKRNKESVWDL